MVTLLDLIKAYLTGGSDALHDAKVDRYIDLIEKSKTLLSIGIVLKNTPIEIQTDPRAVDVMANKHDELEAEGKLDPKDLKLGIFGPLAEALYEGVKDLTDDMSDAAGAKIADMYNTLFTKLTGQPLSARAKKPLAGTNVPEAIEGIMESIIDVGMWPFNKGAAALGKEIPDEADKAIKEILKLGGGLGATVGLGGYIMEHFHPTKSTNAARSLNMIMEMIGFQTLRDAYIRPLRWQLIELPMRYKWNSLIQSMAPGMKEGMEWYGRGHIDEDEFKELREKSGLEAKWDYRFQRMGTKPSSYFMLNAIAKEGFWDADDFKFWLSDAGYGAFQITQELLTPYEVKYGLKPPSNTQIDFLLDAYKQMNLRSTVGDIRGIRRKLMAEGWITRKEFEDDLALYKITAADAKDVLDAIELDQEIKEKKEIAKAYEKKYSYGRITKDELAAKLLELGMRKDWVTAHVEKLFVQKEGKLAVEAEEKILTKSEVIRAYNLGQKPKTWAVQQVDDLGYTTEDALILAESVDQDVKNDTVTEWIRAYELRTTNGRMTITELTTKYIELGKDELWAAARAAYMEERLLGKEEVAV